MFNVCYGANSAIQNLAGFVSEQVAVLVVTGGWFPVGMSGGFHWNTPARHFRRMMVLKCWEKKRCPTYQLGV